VEDVLEDGTHANSCKNTDVIRTGKEFEPGLEKEFGGDRKKKYGINFAYLLLGIYIK
jgi:hypothetical protein